MWRPARSGRIVNPKMAASQFRGGIIGTGAVVANAIHNATGRRVRDFPITPDRLM